jgi:hypothetical protein
MARGASCSEAPPLPCDASSAVCSATTRACNRDEGARKTAGGNEAKYARAEAMSTTVARPAFQALMLPAASSS